MEQITRDKFPSNGGWKFRQPQFGGWENKMAMVGFDASVKNIIEIRKQNQSISVRHGLSTRYDIVANELVTYNQMVRGITNVPHNPVTVIPKMAPAKSWPKVRHDVTQPQDTYWPRMKGRICITTTFDRNYMEAGKTLIKSIKHYTDCTGIDFKIITSDPVVVQAFGADACHFVSDEIRSRYSNVQYSKDLPKERYYASWYRYEMFSLTEYDRVLCIDSDCLCLNDMSYLFSEELNQYDIISVEDHIVSKCFTHFVPELLRQGLNFAGLNRRMAEGKIDLQPALLVANKRLLDGSWYKRLLQYANTTGFTYSIDEGILNDVVYMDNLKVNLLPLEYDYQDLYQFHVPDLPVPNRPIIVHCQDSKPFKKQKSDLSEYLWKWHDRWWYEHDHVPQKTIVVVMVYNRFENLKLWLNAWKRCQRANAELVVIHNLETHNERYANLCRDIGVRYVPRRNVGFDMGAFQDVCRNRLSGFPNDWDNLLWVSDDCLPLKKNFLPLFLNVLEHGQVPCYEISDQVKRHIRTTGFLVTKDIASRLIFPADPIISREACYLFEHRGVNMYEQIVGMGLSPAMVVPDLKESPLWDTVWWESLGLMNKYKASFPEA